MATDLAKLSLWLATLARDHEFEFVDHALKTGDSLVGLTTEQIAATTWETHKPGLPLFQKLVRDRIKESSKGRQEIRDAPDNVFRAVQEARHRNAEERIEPIRVIGDAVISAFFAEAKEKARQKERARIESLLTGALEINLVELLSAARRLATSEHPVRPFHWRLEFPEVFDGKDPGFDAIVGNPPFAGKNTVAAGSRAHYPVWLQTLHKGAHGNADIAAHFYRRAFGLLKTEGMFGLIASNTIAQGDTRASGLATILARGGAIARATRRHKWQGSAQVTTSFVHVRKGHVAEPTLDDRQVERISAYLVEGALDASPKSLAGNSGKAFQGSIVLGTGFTFDDEASAKGEASSLADMQRLIDKDPRNAERIFPYIGGDEVNNHPRHGHHRYVIRLEELTLTEAEQEAPDLLGIIRLLVKPERDKQLDNADGRRRKQFWWRWGRDTPALFRAVSTLSKVLVVSSKASPQYSIASLPTGLVCSQNLNVFAFASNAAFCTMQGRPHELWARYFGTTLEDRLAYGLSDCFATFPFPPGFETDASLEVAGQAYHDHRAALMIRNTQGLTKTYNRFHNPAEDDPDIVKLRELHDVMDRAVLTAYGWTDLAERIATDPDAHPRHLTEDTEDDHKYQGRYFWPAPIRDEVLARLLALNAERAEQERLAGVVVEKGEDEGEDVGEED